MNDRVRARVTVSSRPIWRLRLARNLPRYLMVTVSLAGLAASARFAIAPPPTIRQVTQARPESITDRGAEGYAVLFARRYLSWNGAEPQASAQALEPFVGGGVDPAAGLGLPTSGAQQVQWAEVVQAREPEPGRHIYTVATQTDRAGLVYLSVGVTRTPLGVLALAGYPAFVGAPTAGAPRPGARLREVADPALQTVVERALRNYLADAYGELAADLSAEAHVSLPASPLVLEALQRLSWATQGSSVLAVVQAKDGGGVQYTLAYEIEVTRAQGRWEVSAVQMNPNT